MMKLMKQHLFLMLGYPGAGKSYFARQLAEAIRAVRLNGDGARHLMFDKEETQRNPANNPIVFGALDYAAQQILTAGYSVVIDASHNRKQDRIGKAQLGAAFGIRPILVWVQVPVDMARERQETRERLPDQPLVPPARFEQLVSNLQPPEALEPYIIVDGLAPFAEQLASFRRQLANIEAAK